MGIPALLLIIDLETTGIDVEQNEVIELGAILYSVTHGCVLQQLSTLFPVIDNAAEKVNRISANASQVVGDNALMLQQFQGWVDRTDYLVAHNADFDRQWFGRGVLPAIPKPWLCTYQDFIWEKNHQPASLVNTAINHGVGVNQAHRALTDCQLIASLFDRGAEEPAKFQSWLQRAIKRSQESKYLVIADVAFEQKDLAKEQGFRWNQYPASPWEKRWTKELKESDYEAEKATYPFECFTQLLQA